MGEIMNSYKIIIEKHPDGFVAYPVGFEGVIVGEGDTYEEALENVRSAIRFHIETFGEGSQDDLPEEVYTTETGVGV